MNYVCCGEEIISANQPLIISNRDGLFETMRCINNIVPLASYHFERLFSGLKMLFSEIPPYYTVEYFTKKMNALCIQNKHNLARVRLTMYKDDNINRLNYSIETRPLQNKKWELNDNGLVIGIYDKVKKNTDALSNQKTNSRLPYVYAADYAKQKHWNDAVVLNTNDRVVDTSIANIFIIKDNKIYTPSLSEGCIAGVVRRYIIEQLSTIFSIVEKPLTMQDLEQADEIFLTNAIRGIQWVHSFNNKQYTHTITKSIFNELLKKMPSYS